MLQLGFICDVETNETESIRQLKDAENKRISENVVLLADFKQIFWT